MAAVGWESPRQGPLARKRAQARYQFTQSNGFLARHKQRIAAGVAVAALRLTAAACGGGGDDKPAAAAEGDAASLVAAGLQAQLAGDLQSAKTNYTEAIKKDPNNLQALYD